MIKLIKGLTILAFFAIHSIARGQTQNTISVTNETMVNIDIIITAGSTVLEYSGIVPSTAYLLSADEEITKIEVFVSDTTCGNSWDAPSGGWTLGNTYTKSWTATCLPSPLYFNEGRLEVKSKTSGLYYSISIE